MRAVALEERTILGHYNVVHTVPLPPGAQVIAIDPAGGSGGFAWTLRAVVDVSAAVQGEPEQRRFVVIGYLGMMALLDDGDVLVPISASTIENPMSTIHFHAFEVVRG